MSLSGTTEIALIGTGIAPLIAAARLISQGRSVVLINPESDFFLENSEFSIDPLGVLSLDQIPSVQEIGLNSPEETLKELRPEFPGAIEVWAFDRAERSSKDKFHREKPSFRDRAAPHVRVRARLWVKPERDPSWLSAEDFFVEASDANLNPQLLDGIAVLNQFPGISKKALSSPLFENWKGIRVPRLVDVDVSRYRYGLLEYVRERLGAKLILNASQIELTPDGIRYHENSSSHSIRLMEGAMVFWTPKLSAWILSQAERLEAETKLPQGVRFWEEWSLVSREPLDPSIVGVYQGMTCWAELEGSPLPGAEGQLTHLSVLRPGPIVPLANFPSDSVSLESRSWLSEGSFDALDRLCLRFLNWENYSIRSFTPRAVLDWGDEPDSKRRSWYLRESHPRVEIVGHADGALHRVVKQSRLACEGWE